MAAARNQLLLPPLGEAIQDFSSSSVGADLVLLSPDLQTNQNHPDIQLHVDLHTRTHTPLIYAFIHFYPLAFRSTFGRAHFQALTEAFTDIDLPC